MMVRPAAAADLAAIEAIETAVFDSDRLSRRSLRYFLAAESAMMLVLAFADRVAGYSVVALRKRSLRARLYSIALAPPEHGRGLGRFLLHASEQAAIAHGARFMRLEVRTDNDAAIALYEKNGYRAFESIEDYYDDGAAALRFEKALGSDSDAPRTA
jgi:ribosomal protein S18 acetylase RimI-like enzyme